MSCCVGPLRLWCCSYRAIARRTVLSPSRPQANGLRALNIDIAVVFPPGSGVTAGGVALGPYPPLVFHAPYSTNQGLVSRREEGIERSSVLGSAQHWYALIVSSAGFCTVAWDGSLCCSAGFCTVTWSRSCCCSAGFRTVTWIGSYCCSAGFRTVALPHTSMSQLPVRVNLMGDRFQPGGVVVGIIWSILVPNLPDAVMLGAETHVPHV